MQEARRNGITRSEIPEIITHTAFYAGWPKAWAASRLAKDVWADDGNDQDPKAVFQRDMIFPIGEPNTAYARYFTGNSYIAAISVEQIYSPHNMVILLSANRRIPLAAWRSRNSFPVAA